MSPLSPETLRTIRIIFFDFDGVFTDNTVLISQDGVECVRCWRSDGLGLRRLKDVGVHACILSTEKNPVVTVRAQKLEIECHQGLSDKAQAILAICGERDIEPAQALYLGNDINDIAAFKLVGLPVAVADAYPEVLAHVSARTIAPGGRGAVREVCDDVFLVKNGTTDEGP